MKTFRAVLAAALLLTVASVARAAEDTIGFAIQSFVYTDASRELPMENRSTVPVDVAIVANGGWGVDPLALTLAVGERVSVTVTGNGEDGAKIDVTAAASDPPPGDLASAIALSATVYHESPFKWSTALMYGGAGLIVATLAAATAVASRRRLRRTAPIREERKRS